MKSAEQIQPGSGGILPFDSHRMDLWARVYAAAVISFGSDEARVMANRAVDLFEMRFFEARCQRDGGYVVKSPVLSAQLEQMSSGGR